MPLQSVQIVTGQLDENCYILWSDGSPAAIIFDPGDDAPHIARELASRGLRVEAFLQTHCHFDHIGALSALKAATPAAPLYVPRAEAEWLQRPTLNLSYFFGTNLTGPKPDHLVDDGGEIDAAGLRLKAILVPGHSPGGTAYLVEAPGGPPHLYCGDILFASGIGRTDLPGGAGEEVLIEGIRSRLFCLADETVVHPGHGPETTIGHERQSNPFCAMRV